MQRVLLCGVPVYGISSGAFVSWFVAKDNGGNGIGCKRCGERLLAAQDLQDIEIAHGYAKIYLYMIGIIIALCRAAIFNREPVFA